MDDQALQRDEMQEIIDEFIAESGELMDNVIQDVVAQDKRRRDVRAQRTRTEGGGAVGGGNRRRPGVDEHRLRVARFRLRSCRAASLTAAMSERFGSRLS